MICTCGARAGDNPNCALHRDTMTDQRDTPDTPTPSAEPDWPRINAALDAAETAVYEYRQSPERWDHPDAADARGIARAALVAALPAPLGDATTGAEPTEEARCTCGHLLDEHTMEGACVPQPDLCPCMGYVNAGVNALYRRALGMEPLAEVHEVGCARRPHTGECFPLDLVMEDDAPAPTEGTADRDALVAELIQLTDDDPHQPGAEQPDTCGIPGHTVTFCETCEDGSYFPCEREALRLLAPKIKAALGDLTRENEQLRAERAGYEEIIRLAWEALGNEPDDQPVMAVVEQIRDLRGQVDAVRTLSTRWHLAADPHAWDLAGEVDAALERDK